MEKCASGHEIHHAPCMFHSRATTGNGVLGCDGDTIAVTAATQPSIEDQVHGALPWVPKIKFHNPFLAYENGAEFVKYFRDGAEGKLSPFILVVEGSIPNENNKQEGYWASFGTDERPVSRSRPATGSTNWLRKLGRLLQREPDCTPPLVPDRHLIFAMLLELVSACRNRSKQ